MLPGGPFLADASWAAPLLGASAPGGPGACRCGGPPRGLQGGTRARPKPGKGVGDTLSLEKLARLFGAGPGLPEASQTPSGPFPSAHLLAAVPRSSLPRASAPHGAGSHIADPHTPEPRPHGSFQKCAGGVETVRGSSKTCVLCLSVNRPCVTSRAPRPQVLPAPRPSKPPSPGQHATRRAEGTPRRGHST